MAKADSQRIADLSDWLKRYGRTKKLLSLDDLAILYGLTKPAFVNVRNTIPDFPDPADKKGNAFFYPGAKSVRAMLTYLKRREETDSAHANRFRELSSPAETSRGDHAPLTASEQLKAWELRDRLQKEALAQGHLHRADECAATSERVFSLISRTFGQAAADGMDPNGAWPAAIREAVNQAGKDLVLRCYEEMRDMLAPDVDPGPSRPSPSGTGRSGARKTGATGKRRGAVARKPREPKARR